MDWISLIRIFGFLLILIYFICGIDDTLWIIFSMISGLLRRKKDEDADDVLDFDRLRNTPPKLLAVSIAAWHEANVIGSVITNFLNTTDYPKSMYHLFVGVYPNDPETIAAVEEVGKAFPNVHVVVNCQEGPTTKAQNLNHVIRQIKAFEKENGVPVKVFACIPKEVKDQLAVNERILADGHSDDLAASSEKRLRQAREKLFKGVLAFDSVSTFEINLTRNTVISAVNRNDDLFYKVPGVDIPGPFDLHTDSWAKRILSDNAEQFRELVNRQNLITLYGMGERDPWIEYMVQDRFGNRVWLREIISLSKSDVTGDIMAMVIVRDVTERKKIEI